MNRPLILTFFLLLFWLLAAVASGEDEIPDPEARPSILPQLKSQWTQDNPEALEIPLINPETHTPSDKNVLPLSLEDAIQIALQNNFGLRSEQYSIKIAELEIPKAEGLFDLYLTSDYLYNLSQTTSGIPDFRSNNWDIGLSKPLKTGSLLALNLKLDHTNSGSDKYTGQLNLSFAQSLLKNGGTAIQTAPIAIARKNYLISKNNLTAALNDTIRAVVEAYWDLVFAFQNQEVREKSVNLAKDLLKNNEIQVRLGKMAPNDLLQSKTGIALREEELIAAKHVLQSAQDIIKELLQLERAPIYSSTEIIPSQQIPSLPPQETDGSLSNHIAQALKNRPDYQAIQEEMETRNLHIKVAANQLLPDLEVIGGIGLNGRDGFTLDNESALYSSREPDDGSLEEAFKELFSSGTYQWHVGLRFNQTFSNSVAKAEYTQSKMEAYKTRLTLRALEQQIIFEVKEAWRELELNRKKIQTSATTCDLAEQQLEAEQKKLSLGLSTDYQVLQMEEDLREAQINALLSKAGYWKARVRLDKATGRLIQKTESQN